jgi:hypothetical protein
MEVVADKEGAELLEQQNQGEGEQDLIEVLARVEVTKEAALERRADQQAAQCGGGER